MAQKTVAQLAHELYDNEELEQAILADVDKQGTASLIEHGLSTLPHPKDALLFLEAKKKKDAEGKK